MIFDLQTIGNVLLWASLLFYCIGFLPQVIKNFQAGSTRGLSDDYILLYYAGYNAMLIYGFYCNLSLAYLVLLPIEAGLNGVIVCQRLYYGSANPHPHFVRWAWGITVATVLVASVGLFSPLLVGRFAGWLALVCFTVNQVPQVAKIFRERSTAGFSFAFISMFAVAQTCELIGGLIRALPLPSIVMAVRGLVIYFIYCWQFWMYRQR